MTWESRFSRCGHTTQSESCECVERSRGRRECLGEADEVDVYAGSLIALRGLLTLLRLAHSVVVFFKSEEEEEECLP